MLVEAVTKKGIVKEAADNFGVEPEEIDFLYNSGKNVLNITSACKRI